MGSSISCMPLPTCDSLYEGLPTCESPYCNSFHKTNESPVVKHMDDPIHPLNDKEVVLVEQAPQPNIVVEAPQNIPAVGQHPVGELGKVEVKHEHVGCDSAHAK